MINYMRTATTAAIMVTAINALPAMAEDGQVGILDDGLRVPIEFWWKCVDDVGSTITDFPSGAIMCEDSDGWAVVCDGDPTESACLIYPPVQNPGPDGHASTSTPPGGQTQAQDGGFGGATNFNAGAQLQIER